MYCALISPSLKCRSYGAGTQLALGTIDIALLTELKTGARSQSKQRCAY